MTDVAPSSGPPRSTAGVFLGLLVATVALVVALLEYVHFLDVHRSLWVYSLHDRNAHYLYALKLASALRQGDAFSFLDQLNRARVWPPLHGLLDGLLLAVGGSDYRLAVLPSLFAWAGSAVLAFQVARRALPRHGELAGLVVAILILVSPLHRTFATDVMLESLGACLTLAALYAYLIAVQEGTRTAWRLLALVLTVLFLHKYNYWFLVAVSLALAELAARPGYYRDLGRSLWDTLDVRAFLRRELRQPLSWLLLLAGVASLLILLRGDRPLLLGGKAVNVYPPENPLSLAYALFFLKLLVWWRQGRSWLAGLDDRLRQVLLWHAWPVAGYFLLPKHLSAFLWYMSPGNTGNGVQSSWLQRASFYAGHAAEHYHLAGWSAGLMVVLFGVGLLCWRRLRPGGHALLLLVLVAALLTVSHPNRQGRFLHTWIAVVWLVGALGAVSAAALPEVVGWHRLGAVGALLACVALLGVHARGLVEPPRSDDAGPVVKLPSLLDLTDCYARDLKGAGRATVLSTYPVRPLAQWTYLERHGSFEHLEEYWYGFAEGLRGEANRAGFRSWLETTTCDTVVFIDFLGDPFTFAQEHFDTGCHAEVRDLLLAQTRFRVVKEVPFPQHGCRVLVWKRDQR